MATVDNIEGSPGSVASSMVTVTLVSSVLPPASRSLAYWKLPSVNPKTRNQPCTVLLNVQLADNEPSLSQENDAEVSDGDTFIEPLQVALTTFEGADSAPVLETARTRYCAVRPGSTMYR